MNVPSNDSFDFSTVICKHFVMTWTILYILLLPVFVFVIWVGFQQWRKPRSSSSNATHSDVITFNMAALEVCGVVGFCILMSVFYNWRLSAVYWSYSIMFMVQLGQIAFHNLVCVERYLAVVHPIIYLRLKKNGEVIRNVSIVVVWLFNAVMMFLNHLREPYFSLFSVLIIVFLSFVFVTFLCASVLYVLIRPGPGERSGDRKRNDQSKRRAFYTIAVITVALLLKFVIVFASYMVILFQSLNNSSECLLSVAAQLLNLPSSLVLPMVFLYRRWKLCKAGKVNPA